MLKKLITLFHTVKYLKRRQLFYRIYYITRNKVRELTGYKYPLFTPKTSSTLKLIKSPIESIYNIYDNHSFTFIGLTHKFKDNKIDWNYTTKGKLWNYNLTYFDFLQQESMTKKIKLKLIHSFLNYHQDIRGKRMPFPISLRNINVIKFISKEKIYNKEIDTFIFNQYKILMNNVEYHILGNHLLENAFSLLIGAYYFQDEDLYRKSKEILKQELTEQILFDGAHFELTPMYHQIMLFRLLDCINLIKNNEWKQQELLELLTNKCELMLGWIKTITYQNGDIPLLNDSSNNIAPTTRELLAYASILNIKVVTTPLSSSGYRKYKNKYYESIIDVGNIGPDYIPGHAHSDTFNFELYVKGKPIIVDTGISTYEANNIRIQERSTAAHNTVEVNHKNQTDVWSAFRVAKRAKVIHLSEQDNIIEATHDGYKQQKIFHTRKWEFLNQKIIITDTIDSKKNHTAISYLHFHPNINIEIKGYQIITPFIEINLSNVEKLSKLSYNYSNIFNYKRTSNVVIISFRKKVIMEINIK